MSRKKYIIHIQKILLDNTVIMIYYPCRRRNMPKNKDKQLLQIRISRKLFSEIKEHKDKYYDYFNMSTFFVDTVIKRIADDKAESKTDEKDL